MFFWLLLGTLAVGLASAFTPPPHVICPGDIRFTVEFGTTEKVVSWQEPTVYHDEPVELESQSHTSGSLFPLGLTVVEYVYKDEFRYEGQCTFRINGTSVDTTPPVVTCPWPGDIVDNGEGWNRTWFSWREPTVFDLNGPVTLVSQSHTSPSWIYVGSTTVEYVYEDRAGNKGGCTFTITYMETSPGDSYPRDCKEVYDQYEDMAGKSGMFYIQPDRAPRPFKVYCNDSIDGGGWTVFQRRMDGSDDFHQPWTEYQKGFGLLKSEFWLGNDFLAYLTAQKAYELRIDMNNVNGVPYFAKYDLFRIGGESDLYRITELGAYLPESTANFNAMAYHKDMPFSTYDQDNDRSKTYHCAEFNGAWWFNRECNYDCHLNSKYLGFETESINWRSLPGSSFNLCFTEMKVRPR